MLVRKLVLTLVVAACALSLSFHFSVEGMTAAAGNPEGGQAGTSFDFDEDDQFVLGEPGFGHPAHLLISLRVTSNLLVLPRILRPLLPPPKAV